MACAFPSPFNNIWHGYWIFALNIHVLKSWLISTSCTTLIIDVHFFAFLKRHYSCDVEIQLTKVRTEATYGGQVQEWLVNVLKANP